MQKRLRLRPSVRCWRGWTAVRSSVESAAAVSRELVSWRPSSAVPARLAVLQVRRATCISARAAEIRGNTCASTVRGRATAIAPAAH